ncbi:MAG: tRNA (adenosine(37)-N6)-dimethylallyltransferase MiaA [Acidimicrobiia bacterium]
MADRFGAEILSVDSMQVYRGMDIGTAKPTLRVRERITHHMIDLVDPVDEYDVATFQHMARAVLADGSGRNARMLVVGGSGLHYRAVVDPLEFGHADASVRSFLEALEPAQARTRLAAVDPAAGEHVDLDNPRRVVRALEIYEVTGQTPSSRYRTPEAAAIREYEPLIPHTAIGLDAGDAARERSEQRLDRMLEAGLLAEVESLTGRLGRTAAQAVGYKELLPVVAGRISLDDGVAAARAATKALIKRQRTFFRRDPRIVWIPWQDEADGRIGAVMEQIERTTSWSS